MLELLLVCLAGYGALGGFLLWRHLARRHFIRAGYVNAEKLLKRIRLSPKELAALAREKGVRLRLKTFGDDLYLHPDDAEVIASTVSAIQQSDKEALSGFLEGVASNSLAGIVSGFAVAAVAAAATRTRPPEQLSTNNNAVEVEPQAPPAVLDVSYHRELTAVLTSLSAIHDERVHLEGFSHFFLEGPAIPPTTFKKLFLLSLKGERSVYHHILGPLAPQIRFTARRWFRTITELLEDQPVDREAAMLALENLAEVIDPSGSWRKQR